MVVHRAKQCVVVLGAVCLLAGLTLTPAASSSAAPVALVAVGSPTAPPTGATQLSRPPAGTLSISIALAPTDAAGLAAMAAAVSTPGSPQFRRYLSSSEALTRFGASASSVGTISAYLRSKGLRVDRVLGGLILQASGDARSVARAFHTSLRAFRLAGGEVAYGTRLAPELPISVAASVTGVIGLSDFSTFRSFLARGPSRRLHAFAVRPRLRLATATAPQACTALSDAGFGATASTLATHYGMNDLYTSDNLNGAGVTIAVLEGGASYANGDASGIPALDVSAFARCYGTTASVTAVPVDGGCASNCSADSDAEEVLDLDALLAFAPGASLLAYEAPDLSNQSLLDAEASAVSDDRAQVISISLGACEPDAGSSFVTAEAREFQLAAVQGQSVLVASGDQGSEACLADDAATPYPSAAYATQMAVDDPASQPFVTAVGGTSIQSSEQVWNNGPYARYGANSVSTGGISENWIMPAWQVGFDVSGLASGVPCGAPSGSDCREVPDVAASADPYHDGFLLLDNCTTGAFSSCNSVEAAGGTSFSAPYWAALTALFDQASSASGHRLGFLNPVLYAAERSSAGAFGDVTTGNNDYLLDGALAYPIVGGDPNYSCAYSGTSGLPCYEATAGYDMATGLGTPDAPSLLPLVTLGTSTTLPSVSSALLPGATVGASYSATVTATSGTAPYVWSLESGTLPAGLSLSSSGTISGTPTSAGVSSFVLDVRDANDALASRSLSVSVASSPIVLTSDLPVGTADVPYSATLTAAGGTAPISWTLAAGLLPDGMALGGGGTLSGTPTSSGDYSFTVATTDAAGASDSAMLTLDVTAPFAVTTTALPNARVKASYRARLVATGGSGRLRWRIVSGLPRGLRLARGGVVRGTTAALGVHLVSVAVSDRAGHRARALVLLDVVRRIGRLVLSSSALRSDGRRVELPVRCERAVCRGTLQLVVSETVALTRGRRAPRGASVVASGSFHLRAGEAGAIALSLTRSGSALLGPSAHRLVCILEEQVRGEPPIISRVAVI